MLVNLIIRALENNERILVFVETNYAVRTFVDGLKSLAKHVEQSLSHVYLLQREALQTLDIIEIQEENSVSKTEAFIYLNCSLRNMKPSHYWNKDGTNETTQLNSSHSSWNISSTKAGKYRMCSRRIRAT